MQVRFLESRKESLDKEIAQSSMLAWEKPMDKKHGGLLSIEVTKSQKRLSTSTSCPVKSPILSIYPLFPLHIVLFVVLCILTLNVILSALSLPFLDIFL